MQSAAAGRISQRSRALRGSLTEERLCSGKAPGTAGASPESLDRGPPGGMAGKLSPPARLAEPGEAPQGTIRGTASGKERGSSHQCPIGLLSPASASTWSAAPGQQLEHKRSSPPIDTPLHRRWDGLWADRRTSCVNPFIHAVLGGRVIRTSTNTAAGSIRVAPPGDDPLRALAAQRVSPAPRLQRQYFRGKNHHRCREYQGCSPR